jgi:predicted metal-dependent hydrolase
VENLMMMVNDWAAKIGVQPSRVRMRTMTSRWGSCSGRGNINLNRSLCYLPSHLAEYVVCHELIHLRVFNHSKAFKAMLSQYMPDWKAREKELKVFRP